MFKKQGTLILPVVITLAAAVALFNGCTNTPNAIETFTGEDGSTWEQVSEPGFGNANNMSVAALGEYEGRLYAMTRNDIQGTEVWRTTGGGWEQVKFPDGAVNGIYGNPLINALWGGIIEFKGKLYFGFSAGVQGNVLKSSGCEIWRYDGKNWEPVISDKKGADEAGTITAISSCGDHDGNTTAQFTDNTRNWTADQWAGGTLRITSGEGKFRKFDIVSNTADTLTVQQNELAGDGGTEYTICAKKHYSNPFPAYEYDLGAVQPGDSYEIGTGYDQSGFGDYWNKAITKMALFNNKLYVSTGLNYDNGAQVWFTADGDSWEVTQPTNSFGNFHTSPGYKNSQKPVSSSITYLCASDVSGQSLLYAGGTGTSCSGCTQDKGPCSRVAKLVNNEWVMIVDSSVPELNGFGQGNSCTMFNGNFMPWSLASFKNKLFTGINSLGGTRVMYTTTGSSAAGSWAYSVGGDSAYPVGFDGALLQTNDPAFQGTYANISTDLFPFNDTLYAGCIFQKSDIAPTGSQLWKTADGTTWTRITGNSFGDTSVLAYEGFAVFNKTMYVGANNASSSQSNAGGAKVFRLAE
ncbi:MAG: hypothetical protein NTV89_11180 [Proteobacteria bacterium]|nr:hypothetical protein [Pseudomonadota bacterium]